MLARTKAQVLKDALARADERPDEFLNVLRSEVEIAGAPRGPDGRVVYKDRFKPISPLVGRHPNTLAALDMHRWGTLIGGPNWNPRKCARICTSGKPCGKYAVRESRFCTHHGGRKVIEERKRQMFRDYRPDRAVLGLSALRQIARMGRVPFELLRDVPEFREAYQRSRFGVSVDNPLFADWTYGQRRQHHEACTMLALAYLAAWEAIKHRGDWQAWMDCTRRAVLLGLTPS